MFKDYSFSLVITAFNEGPWVKKTIDGILADQSYSNYEIIVVNDGSTDDSFAFIELQEYQKLVHEKKLKIIKKNNLGVSKGRHAGAEYAKGDILIFLDAHMVIQPGWLSKIKQTFFYNPHVKVLGIAAYDIKNGYSPARNYAAIYTAKDITMITPTWITITSDPHSIRPVPFVNACAFIIYSDIYKQTGGFLPFLEGWGPEDRFFSLLLYFYGYTLYLNPNISIGHRYIKSEEQTTEVKAKKSQVLYNSLAATYVLYDTQSFIDNVEVLRKKYPNLEERPDFQLFLDKKNELDKYKSRLEKNRQKSYKNFTSDFSHYLPYLFVHAYNKALQIKKHSLNQAISLLGHATKIEYTTPAINKERFLAMTYFRLSELFQTKNIDEAIMYAHKSLSHNANYIPTLKLLSTLFFRQKKYKNSLAFLLAALELYKKGFSPNNEFNGDDYSNLLLQIHDELSIAYSYHNKLSDAEYHAIQALALCQSCKRIKANKDLFIKLQEKRSTLRS